MIVSMYRDTDTVEVTATPDELFTEMATGSRPVNEQPTAYSVAGYTVINVAKAQHDGHPAVRLVLADSTGAREIGRMVIREDATREETLEWSEIYETVELAKARVSEWKAAKENPVATATVDFAWEAYPSLEMGIAEIAAEYGVSIRVVKEYGPAAGWPVIEVTGLREKVRHLLKKGWDYSDEMIAEELN